MGGQTKIFPSDKGSGRLEYIDVLKGFGILSIVIAHCSPLVTPEKFMSSYMIPLFLMISGYLFNYDKYKDSFLLLVKTRAKRLVLPYFVCFFLFFIYWLLFTFSGSLSLSSLPEIIDMFLYKLLGFVYGCGSVETSPPLSDYIMPIYALWFVPVLFVTDILFWLFLKLTGNLNILFRFVLLLLLSFSGVYIGKLLFLPWGIDIALVGLIFLWFGYIMREYDLPAKICNFVHKNILLLSLSFLWLLSVPFYGFSFNDRSYDNLPLAFVSSTAIVIVFFSLAKMNTNFINYKNIFSYLGNESLLIMCIHFNIYRHIPVNSLIKQSFVLEILFALFASLALGIIFKQIPFMKNVFSKSDK